MPRRALSTLRAEIKDGGPFGTSIELSDSSTCVVAVSEDSSLELLIRSLRGFEAKEAEFGKKVPFLGIGAGKFCPEIYTVAVVDEIAMAW